MCSGRLFEIPALQRKWDFTNLTSPRLVSSVRHIASHGQRGGQVNWRQESLAEDRVREADWRIGFGGFHFTNSDGNSMRYDNIARRAMRPTILHRDMLVDDLKHLLARPYLLALVILLLLL